jgi:hypothetical protein
MAATAAKQAEQVIPPKTLGEIPAGLIEPKAPKRCIYERINAVMRDVRGVGKNSENKHFKYKYAGHESVTDALRDAYAKHGIVRSATVLRYEITSPGTILLTVKVSWICTDEPTSRHEVEIPALQPSDRNDKGHDPMQIGKALSYAVKNAEFKVFALTGDDTPDAEDDDRGEYDHRSDEPSGARNLAVEYLGRFTEVRSTDELDALKKEIRANWAAVKTVQGIAERMVEAQRKAQQRLRERQSGED